MIEGDPAQTPPPGSGTPFLVFVGATAPSALRAMRNIEQCLHEHGMSADGVEVIDVFREPRQALAWGVFASPALIRRADPEQRLYGDLSDADLLARFLLGNA